MARPIPSLPRLAVPALLLAATPAWCEIKVTLCRTEPTLQAGRSVQLLVYVEGTLDQRCTFQVTGQAGTVDAGGRFTASAEIKWPEQVVVRATSVADPTRFHEITFQVVPGTRDSASRKRKAEEPLEDRDPKRAAITGSAIRLPFLDPETGEAFVATGDRRVASRTLHLEEPRVVGYGTPVASGLTPAELARGPVLVSTRQGGRWDHSLLESPEATVTFTGAPAERWVQILEEDGQGGWKREIRHERVKVRGLMPWLGEDGKPWSRDGVGTSAGFLAPSALVAAWVDGEERVYILDAEDHVIRVADAQGRVETLCGRSGESGYRDGLPAEARFNGPTSMIEAPGGEGLLVADTGNHALRLVTWKGLVKTLAGGREGHQNGEAETAQFSRPRGLALSPGGRVAVADAGNHRIRMLERRKDGWWVGDLAGSGDRASKDGPRAEAGFGDLKGLAFQGHLLVAADGSHLRTVSIHGVTTLAPVGMHLPSGVQDDVTARLLNPQALLATDQGLLVTDAGANAVFQLLAGASDATGEHAPLLTRVAGVRKAKAFRPGLLYPPPNGLAGEAYGALRAPRGLAVLADGDWIVASGNAVLRMGAPTLASLYRPWDPDIQERFADPEAPGFREDEPIALAIASPRKAQDPDALEPCEADVFLTLAEAPDKVLHRGRITFTGPGAESLVLPPQEACDHLVQIQARRGDGTTDVARFGLRTVEADRQSSAASPRRQPRSGPQAE